MILSILNNGNIIVFFVLGIISFIACTIMYFKSDNDFKPLVISTFGIITAICLFCSYINYSCASSDHTLLDGRKYKFNYKNCESYELRYITYSNIEKKGNKTIEVFYSDEIPQCQNGYLDTTWIK